MNLTREEISLVYNPGHYDIIYGIKYIKIHPLVINYDNEKEIEELERLPEELEGSSEVATTIFNRNKKESVQYRSLNASKIDNITIEKNIKKKNYMKYLIKTIMLIILSIFVLISFQCYINDIKHPELRTFENMTDNS